jgi:predicted hotdog family 3-hydroxylacyl-ACP dehydratase
MPDLTLPLPAERLLPHRPPMLCLDSLRAVSETQAEAAARLAPGHILVHEGRLCEAGLVELAAQTLGAMQGYWDMKLGRPVRDGFLAAAQRFSFFDRAGLGDDLRITVDLVAELGGMHLVEAVITKIDATGEPTTIAAGKLKVFVPEQE